MAVKNAIGELVEKVKESVKGFRESGVKDELILVVPFSVYLNWLPSWERVKEETGVDYVEPEPTLMGLYEAIVMQRSEYLRMVVNTIRSDEK